MQLNSSPAGMAAREGAVDKSRGRSRNSRLQKMGSFPDSSEGECDVPVRRALTLPGESAPQLTTHAHTHVRTCSSTSLAHHIHHATTQTPTTRSWLLVVQAPLARSRNLATPCFDFKDCIFVGAPPGLEVMALWMLLAVCVCVCVCVSRFFLSPSASY